jgi:hypothetical protein
MNKLEKLQYLCTNLPKGIICDTPYGKLKLVSINVADGNDNALLGFGFNERGDTVEYYLSEVEVNTN